MERSVLMIGKLGGNICGCKLYINQTWMHGTKFFCYSLSYRFFQTFAPRRKAVGNVCGVLWHNFNSVGQRCNNIQFIRELRNETSAFPSLKNKIFFRYYSLCNLTYSFPRKEHKSFTFHYGNFHTSQKRYLHPIIWMFIKPIAKGLAILSGRQFRKWWKDLPLKKKAYFYQIIKKHRLKISGITLVSSGLGLVYYWSHIQETPITKRKRFVAFTPDQFQAIANFEYETQLELHKSNVLPATHPATKLVSDAAFNLLKGNTDIKQIHDKKWSITVVNNPTQNAFVLPNGQIFVFTGMLNLCSNEHQLGAILAHEMAHCILGHAAEQVSFAHLVDFLIIVVLTAIWAFLPSDGIAIVTQWFFNKVIAILLHLPYNRKLEAEADEVGLQLAAKSCFDVRESSAFWSKMAIQSTDKIHSPEAEWLSTHPSHETRSVTLDSLMEKALELRSSCGCPKLTRPDPRVLKVPKLT